MNVNDLPSLYNKYADIITRAAWHFTGELRLAQESTARAFEALAQADENLEDTQYLLKLLMDAVIFARERIRELDRDITSEYSEFAVITDNTASSAEERRALRSVLSIAEKNRIPFYLNTAEGLSAERIADILADAPEETEKAIACGKELFREECDTDDPEKYASLYTAHIKKITARPNPYQTDSTSGEPEPAKKNRKAVFAAVTAACLIIGVIVCVFAFRDKPEPEYDFEVITSGEYLDYAYYTPEEAIETAQIIMIGEYTDSLDRNEPPAPGPSGHFTVNTIRAVKVFKGEELLTDGTVDIYQNYQYVPVENGRDKLYLDTHFTPMFEGDRAIFLLTYVDAMDLYVPIELQGRFPMPENKDKPDRLGFVNGIRDNSEFRNDIYIYLKYLYNIKEEEQK